VRRFGILSCPESLVTIAKHPTIGYFAIHQFPQWHPARQSRILAERFEGWNQELVQRNQYADRQLNEKQDDDDAADAAASLQEGIKAAQAKRR
jgi:hypothetical protein